MAFMNAMSIGFSVFQTSGAKATSNAIAANATANTASEPSHSFHRTGSPAGSTRAARRDRRRRASMPPSSGAPRRRRRSRH